MRNGTIYLIFIALCFTVCKLEAITYKDFFDGQVHEINNTNSTGSEEMVRVDYGYPGVGTTLNIVSGGKIGMDCHVFEDSILNLLGGEITGGLFTSNNSHVTIYDGLIGDALHSHEYSHVDIYGGQIDLVVDAMANSEIAIFGGTFNMTRADWYGHIDISGGIFNDRFKVTQNASMTIYGTDFAIDGFSVGYGPITTMSGTLSGMLNSGEAINVPFEIVENASITLVPEPATVLLLALGGLFLRRRR